MEQNVKKPFAVVVSLILIISCLNLSCKKSVEAPNTTTSSNDSISVTATVTYFNCNNTGALTIYTNKNKILSDIEGAGFGANNLALSDSVTYKMRSTDSVDNQVKPVNFIKKGDSVRVLAYVIIGKTVPVGDYGFSIHVVVKTQNQILTDSYHSEFKPSLKIAYAYDFQYIMP